jgi:hypothetical protein
MFFNDIGTISKTHLCEAFTENSSISNFTSLKIEDYFSNEMAKYNKELNNFKKNIAKLDIETHKKIENEISNIKIIKSTEKSANSGRSLNRVKKIEEQVSFFVKKKKEIKFCEVGTSHGFHTIKNLVNKKILKPEQCSGFELIPEYCYFLATYKIDMYIANFLKDDISTMIECDKDLVVITEVIEHMPNEQLGFDILSKSIKLLKKGGSVITSYPFDASPITKSPGGHQYQPILKNITNKFKSLFEKVRIDNDGKRQIIIFENLNEVIIK